jgi:hypothetical protein
VLAARVHVGGGAAVRARLAVLTALVAGEVVGGEGLRGGPAAHLLEHEGVVALLDVDVAHLAVGLTPGVADDPVLLLGVRILAPADDGDDVVNSGALAGRDAGGVVQDRGGVNAARNRATGEDFLGHVVSALDRTELGDRRVGVLVEADALAAHLREGGAGARDVLCLAVAVALLGPRAAEAIRGLLRAGNVRVVGVVGDASFAEGLDPLVDRSAGAAVAGSRVAAVQDVLHGQVDVDARALAGDLDAVAEGTDGAMRPAGAAVLRNVLVERLGDEALAILVGPGEGVREVLGLDVVLRARAAVTNKSAQLSGAHNEPCSPSLHTAYRSIAHKK